MKFLLVLLSFLLTSLSYSQSGSVIKYSLTADDYNILYVLDSAHYPRERIRWVYRRRKRIQFLNITKGDVFLLASFNRNHSYSGELDGLKVLQNEEGRKVIHFYARGKGYNTGQVMSFDVVQITSSNFSIKYYNKFGLVNDVTFYAHLPTKKELDDISNRLSKFNKKDKSSDK